MKYIKLNDEIRRKTVLAYNSYRIKTSSLLKQAEREGVCVIEDKRKVIKRDLEMFKKAKITALRLNYENSIDHFGLGGCSRHPDKIGRFYTPITNLPKGLFNFITTQNGEYLTSIDLKNSQMLLLVYLIDKIREAQTTKTPLTPLTPLTPIKTTKRFNFIL